MKLIKNTVNKLMPMYRAAALLLAVAFCSVLAACGGSGSVSDSPSSDSDTKSASEAEQTGPIAIVPDKVLKLGVIQFVEHVSLDEAYKGFLSGLEKIGYKEGENLQIDFKNAQGEQANCQTIAAQFENSDYDLILAIATPAAQAVANVVTDKPILVTAVTDLESTQLVHSNKEPGVNVSGTSDMSPIDKQIKLIKDLNPAAKKIGIMYSSAEANSELQVEDAERCAKELGLEVEKMTISSTNEVQQAAESIMGDIDALYLPSDNAIASSMPTVAKVAIKNKVPIVPAVEAMCAEGGLASYSINYFDLGEQTAKMAGRVIGGEDIAKMPVEFAEKTELVINSKYAEEISYKFSDDILSKSREAKLG